MKKNLIVFISLVFFIFISLGGYVMYNNYKIKNEHKLITENKEKKEQNLIKKQTKQEKKINTKKIGKSEKIKNFKKSLQTKGLIIKGDISLKNNEYLFALKRFLQANKQTPNNPKIIEKIAKSYFLMKKYDLALKYYSKLKKINNKELENYYLSFLYSTKLEENNFNYNGSGILDNSQTILIEKTQNELKKIIKNNNEELFYYKNSLECIKSFHICKANFENYFKNTSYSGKNKNLEEIRKTIANYKNLKLNELYYKNALIIGTFLKNKNYPISIILGENLLKDKKNYKPILKIIAQSYYNLGKTDKAKQYLIKYVQLDTKDADVSYMLGAINQKQHNYIQSNIFLDLSLKQEYFDIDSIHRLKLYNYLMLDQKEKINQIFDKIIVSQKKPFFNDLVLASYYNIIDAKFSKALLYIEKGIKLYPEREDFYGLKAWIFIEQNKLDKAEKLLKKAESINSRNAVISLNLGRLELLRYKQDNQKIKKLRATIFLKKTIELDNSEIGNLAKKLLEEIDN